MRIDTQKKEVNNTLDYSSPPTNKVPAIVGTAIPQTLMIGLLSSTWMIMSIFPGLPTACP